MVIGHWWISIIVPINLPVWWKVNYYSRYPNLRPACEYNWDHPFPSRWVPFWRKSHFSGNNTRSGAGQSPRGSLERELEPANHGSLFRQRETGIDLLRIEPDERILALTINLEYIGPEADIIGNKFVKVIDDKGQLLNFREDFILNNGAIPNGGMEWLAISEGKQATRHFISGEQFQSLVLFFVGSADLKGLVLQIDDLPEVNLSGLNCYSMNARPAGASIYNRLWEHPPYLWGRL